MKQNTMLQSVGNIFKKHFMSLGRCQSVIRSLTISQAAKDLTKPQFFLSL